jgi:catechol 2,3-dioxygenase-like lactoylglutathione lyase family enzyme
MAPFFSAQPSSAAPCHRRSKVRHLSPINTLAVGIILSLLTAPAQAQSEEEAGFVTAFIRLAMVVSDVERSKHFYQHALGYRARFDGDITRPAVLTQLGLSDDHRVRFVVLASPDTPPGVEWPDAAMLGLLSVDPALPVMSRPKGADLAIGEGMLATVTTDMDTVYERLQELKARVLLPPMTSPDGSERELVFHDPDGIRVHVVERQADRRSP